MRIENTPPPYSASNLGDPTPPEEPPDVVNAINQLYAICGGMAGKQPMSFDMTNAAANSIHALTTYWLANPPAAGSEDAIVYGYLTGNDPAVPGGQSIEKLCTPGADGKMLDANIADLQNRFKDTDSFATRIFNIVSNKQDTHYWYSHVTYSYSWTGDPGGLASDVSTFDTAWGYAYNHFDTADNPSEAQRCARALNNLFTNLEQDGKGSCYTDLLDHMWNTDLENPGKGTSGPDSLKSICARLANAPTAADAKRLYNMLVQPRSGPTNDLASTFIAYITSGDYVRDVITPAKH